MILSDNAIELARQAGAIVIEPFDPACLGGNSYDVHLSPYLKTYVTQEGSPGWQDPFGNVMQSAPKERILDCAQKPRTTDHFIAPDGLVLRPGILYLGSTIEYTETHDHVPYLDGKSSIGRLGIQIHMTAGRGDVGFKGHWTMEITVVHPVRVYAGMPIGQLTFHTVQGEVSRRYDTKTGAKYTDRDPRPQASRMWRNFPPKTEP